MLKIKNNIILGMMAVCLPMLSACEMEKSSNGDLDGFWHLEAVDTLATGGTCDYSERKVFWGVQHKLVAVRNFAEDSPSLGFYFRFSQTGDSLILSSPYANHWHEGDGEQGGDIPVEEVTDEMRSYGINLLEEHYHKEALSGSKMILSTSKLRLRFKKF